MPASYPPVTGVLLPGLLLILACAHRSGSAVSACRWVVMLVGFVPLIASAAVWTVEPSIDASTSYADNVTLAAEGQEQGEFVLGVSPGVSVRADGRQLNMLFNYGFEKLYYVNDSSRNYSRQLFQGRADAELVPDFIFLDGSGRISQQLVDPLGSAGLGELAVSENVGEVSTWTLSPSLRRRMGDLLLELGMNFDIVDYPAASRDSYARDYRFDIGSNPQLQHVAVWRLGLSRREVFFDGDDANQLYETVSGLFRYHLSPEWSLETNVGYVRNSFQYDPLTAASPEGRIWTATITWEPTPRTLISAGVGEHFFGSTHFANIRHRSRFNTLQYNYTEEISSARQLQVNQNRNNPSIDENGTPVISPVDPETGQPAVDLLVVSQTTEVFVAKRNRFNWGFRSLHASFGAESFHERRHLQSSGGTETVIGGGVNTGWHPSGRSDFLANYSEQTVNFMTGREDHYRDLRLEARRRFRPKLTGVLQYLRNARESSDSAITKYVNRVVTVRVHILF